jgi:hypothetical protein
MEFGFSFYERSADLIPKTSEFIINEYSPFACFLLVVQLKAAFPSETSVKFNKNVRYQTRKIVFFTVGDFKTTDLTRLEELKRRTHLNATFAVQGDEIFVYITFNIGRVILNSCFLYCCVNSSGNSTALSLVGFEIEIPPTNAPPLRNYCSHSTPEA